MINEDVKWIKNQTQRIQAVQLKRKLLEFRQHALETNDVQHAL